MLIVLSIKRDQTWVINNWVFCKSHGLTVSGYCLVFDKKYALLSFSCLSNFVSYNTMLTESANIQKTTRGPGRRQVNKVDKAVEALGLNEITK